MSARPADTDYLAWVERFAISHHHKDVMWHLVFSGPPALEAVRAGLAHDDPAVRRGCTQVLDHLVDDDALDDLLEMANDDVPEVRFWALHALACERCKENGCSPTKATVVPIALAALGGDPVPRIRGAAIGVLARWVHDDPAVEAAIVTARDADPDRGVRKTAMWWSPGGPRYEKTKPKVRRVRAAR